MQTKTAAENRPILVWDTHDILVNQARYLVDEGQAKNEDEGFDMACQDQDLMAWEWECLTDELTETLKEINPGGSWHAEVENFGWRRLSGYSNFKAEDGKEFLSSILPDTDCTFDIFLEADNALKIHNFHHDSPTGEWYTIRQAVEEEERQAEAA
jgi:hypothetical protein